MQEYLSVHTVLHHILIHAVKAVYLIKFHHATTKIFSVPSTKDIVASLLKVEKEYQTFVRLHALIVPLTFSIIKIFL